MPLVDYYIDSGVLVVTLLNSEGGNVLNREILRELSDTLSVADTNSDVRVVVLRSDGKVFSRGMDFGAVERHDTPSGTAEDAPASASLEGRIRKAVAAYVEVLKKIYTLRKPVISILRGEVKAGGVGLVAATDIVLATHEVSFQLSEVLFGLLPANVLPFLLERRISAQKARYLVLTSKTVNAREALSLGMVDELFEPETMESGTKKIIKNLLRSSPKALAETKTFTAQILSMEFPKRIQYAQEKLIEMMRNPEVRAGIKAFQNGDVPAWFGSLKLERPLTVHQSSTDCEKEEGERT